jgi:hypothetical protein
MSERERQIGRTELEKKIWSGVFIALLVGLVVFTLFTNVQVGVHVLNETETTEKYKREGIKANIVVEAYMDSVSNTNRKLSVTEKERDSIVRLREGDLGKIKALEQQVKILGDSLNASSMRVSDLQPVKD